MAATLELLPEEMLAHILSLVPPTPPSENLGGLEFFLLQPGERPAAGAGTAGAGAGAAAGAGSGVGTGTRADPTAHGTGTPRIATPAGARELAALSATCKGLCATLSAEAVWAPFLQQLELFSQPWEGQHNEHWSHSREEGQGYEIPEYAGPPVYIGKTFIKDTAHLPFEQRGWEYPGCGMRDVVHFEERVEGEVGGLLRTINQLDCTSPPQLRCVCIRYIPACPPPAHPPPHHSPLPSRPRVRRSIHRQGKASDC